MRLVPRIKCCTRAVQLLYGR
uniref:Uncharacterized protein n=1 Tax=Anguilla anguilla TaxID=7936 RepID=A0A0E9UGL4_ANGAN